MAKKSMNESWEISFLNILSECAIKHGSASTVQAVRSISVTPDFEKSLNHILCGIEKVAPTLNALYIVPLRVKGGQSFSSISDMCKDSESTVRNKFNKILLKFIEPWAIECLSMPYNEYCAKIESKKFALRNGQWVKANDIHVSNLKLSSHLFKRIKTYCPDESTLSLLNVYSNAVIEARKGNSDLGIPKEDFDTIAAVLVNSDVVSLVDYNDCNKVVSNVFDKASGKHTCEPITYFGVVPWYVYLAAYVYDLPCATTNANDPKLQMYMQKISEDNVMSAVNTLPESFKDALLYQLRDGKDPIETAKLMKTTGSVVASAFRKGVDCLRNNKNLKTLILG